MRLAMDIGNTAVKWAAFEGHEPVEQGVGLPMDLLAAADSVLACASGVVPDTAYDIPLLDSETPLPIRLDYKTPQTLGADRIAAACGAWSLHRGDASVVIDAGTCITVDFVSADGVYHGGAIMPGLGMSLQALHTQTARLPLVGLEGVDRAPVLGRSTEECILAGTLGATMLALAGYVALYRERCPQLHVLLTGGDAQRLAGAAGAGWETVPLLTLRGLNEVMAAQESGRADKQ